MNDTQTPTSDAVEPDFAGGFFDEWIAGASPARRAVTIYGKPSLFADYQEVDRELQIARAVAAEGGGVEMGGSTVAALERRLSEIYDEWMATRTTWIVTTQGDEAHDKAAAAVKAELGLEKPEKPEEPERPAAPERVPALPKNATEVQKRAHTVRAKAFEQAQVEHAAAMIEWEGEYKAYIAGPFAEWETAFNEWADQVNYRLIASSLVEIKDAEGTVRQTTITVEQLQTLAKRLGKTQVMLLMAGIQGATLEDSEIPAPFSPASSEDAPTS